MVELPTLQNFRWPVAGGSCLQKIPYRPLHQARHRSHLSSAVWCDGQERVSITTIPNSMNRFGLVGSGVLVRYLKDVGCWDFSLNLSSFRRGIRRAPAERTFFPKISHRSLPTLNLPILHSTQRWRYRISTPDQYIKPPFNTKKVDRYLAKEDTIAISPKPATAFRTPLFSTPKPTSFQKCFQKCQGLPHYQTPMHRQFCTVEVVETTRASTSKV